MNITWFLQTVAVPVLVIGVLVFVHEFGHFLFAKLCRVGVVRFAIGFGPAVCRWQRGETSYQIGIIPLGGYVRMVGDLPDPITGEQETDDAIRKLSPAEREELERMTQIDRSRWFIEKSLAARSSIVFAGPLFNLLFAIIVVAGSVFFYGEQAPVENAVIGKVMKNAPAEKAGLRVDDLVTAIDGNAIATWAELQERIHNGDGSTMKLKVLRAGQEVDLAVVPQEKELPDFSGEKLKVYLIGIEPALQRIPHGPLGSLKIGALWTSRMSLHTLTGLWGMLSGVVSPKDLAGPLFIFDAATQQVKKGAEDLLFFTALLSVSLGVLNLLPIPILDGGHLMFFLFEAVIGPLSIKKKEIAQQVGLVFLLAMMVFAIHNDLSRDSSKMNSDVVEWKNEDAPKSP